MAQDRSSSPSETQSAVVEENGIDELRKNYSYTSSVEITREKTITSTRNDVERVGSEPLVANMEEMALKALHIDDDPMLNPWTFRVFFLGRQPIPSRCEGRSSNKMQELASLHSGQRWRPSFFINLVSNFFSSNAQYLPLSHLSSVYKAVSGDLLRGWAFLDSSAACKTRWRQPHQTLAWNYPY